MTPLRQRFIEDLQLRNRSERTIEAYVRQVARFARHFGRSPEQLGPEQVREYQLHLLARKVSWSAFNQCVCALRFLYGTTLGRSEHLKRLPYGRRPKKLPVVLSQKEALELLLCVEHRGYRMVLTTMYATGLRIGEAVALRVADLDSRQMTILVARGKGNKQRLVPLSRPLLGELRAWWQSHCDPVWLFPGSRPDRPMDVSPVQRACQAAVRRAKLKRGVSTHTLRHTFATELLEAGVDLLTIREILGHASLSTTAIYTHVRRDRLVAVAEVLGLLPLEQLRQDTVKGAPAKRSARRKESEK
ncbi:MAG: tyrosine-type recombinase/integrase [Phycisphaerae bacterium]|nr:tyrosine-type recombinase/integrase [Phycisphaerae bacterium]